MMMIMSITTVRGMKFVFRQAANVSIEMAFPSLAFIYSLETSFQWMISIKTNHRNISPGRTKGNYGQECPLVCTVTCEDDEVLCPGDTLSSGCRESDFCHPKGTGINGVICEGFCPKECQDPEHKCPVPNGFFGNWNRKERYHVIFYAILKTRM